MTIKEICHNRNVRVVDVASVANVSVQQIYNLDNRKDYPDFDIKLSTVSRIAKFLDVSPKLFIGKKFDHLFADKIK